MRMLCFLAVCLTGASLLAETGIVLMDGLPLSRATVTIIGHSGSARTDRNGRFVWTPLPRFPFEVLVVMPSGEYMKPVLITGLTQKLLTVEVEPIGASTVTVSSRAAPHIEVPPTNARSMVGADEIELREPVRIADLLSDFPGVSSISEGQALVPVIRGLARGRTLLLLDGGRVTAERRVGPSATFVDPLMLEGVEVARGPGSVAYGSDAIGGVIHLRTLRPSFQEALRVRLTGGMSAGFPSQQGALLVSQGFQKWAYLVRGSAREFQDYESPLGQVTNSGAKNRNALFTALCQVGDGVLSLGWQSDQSKDVGRPRTNSLSERFYYPEESSDRLTASYEFPPVAQLSRLKLDFFVGSYRLVTSRDRPPAREDNRTIQTSDVDASDVGFRLLAIRPLRKSRLEFGVDLNSRFGLRALNLDQDFDGSDRLVSTAIETAIHDASRFDAGFFSSLEHGVGERLLLSGGIRFDQVSTSNRGGTFGSLSTSNAAVSGFASAMLELTSNLSVSGQIARGFRDPVLSDRYFKGVSGRGLIEGNPQLEPETTVQFDTALRYDTPGRSLALYLYRYRIDDLVERFEEGDNRFFFRNRGRATLSGIEFETGWYWSGGWGVEAGAELMRGEAEDGSRPDDIPPRRIRLAVSKSFLERAQVEVRTLLLDRDDSPGPNEVVTPGHTSLDLLGRVRLTRDFSLLAAARNLLDQDFPASPDRRAPLAPGRSLSFLVTYDF